ncbi:4Fe-4S binding protein [Methanosarcina sp. Kolksee]|uniref:4Fe-4S binding protein n=1 Tax=Methanosarcina sp. Kolksee TaxID=1434099 RepID=UPI000AA01E0B|nr:4Fe-4S binding protein [Methanosarcina sp. Kolksee]
MFQSNKSESKGARCGTDHLKYSFAVSFTAAVITGLILYFLVGRGDSSSARLAVTAFIVIIGTALTFFILWTGRVNFLRMVTFIGIDGLIFTIALSLEHEVQRGSILLTNQALNNNSVPICPITIPFVAVPYFTEGKMVFPSPVTSLFAVLFMWLGLVLILGRGWCGWICFFGWMDQFFASLLKKPIIPLENPPKWAKLFPYAFMLFLILVSAVFLIPIFCAFICPLRIIYDPPGVTTTFEWITALIFVTGGLIFLVIGPLLTKKRLFCSFICPLMPANTLIGVINPFKVKIDTTLCKKCGLCVKSCELFAITKESLAKGRTTIECAKCGKCMDKCPAGAINYKLMFTDQTIRLFFIPLAIIVNLLIASGFIWMVVHYLMTGEIVSFQ